MKAVEVRVQYFMAKYPWVGPVFAVMLVILVSLYAIGAYKHARTTQEGEGANLAEAIRTGEAPRPEYTAEVAAKVAMSTKVSALISYTDNGFEPTTLRISSGEAVRFTNNSSGDLWVATADGATVYPRTHESCGSSDLDSCVPLAPMDFWEFTFEARGEWRVVNNLDKSKGLTVIVE